VIRGLARQHRDVDRRQLALVRQHVEDDLLALGEPALVGEAFSRHEPLHEGEVLVEAVAFLLGIGVVADEFVREIARAHAEDEPPARHHVDHRIGLGDAARIVEGEDRDGGAEPDHLRALRQRREHHRRIRDHAIFVEMMLGAEEGVVAERLGQLRMAHHLAVELGHRARQARMMIVDRE
jgi:hypothetical protein